MTQRRKNPKNKPPMVAFYSALSGDAGIEADHPQLHIPEAQISQTLTELGLARGGYAVFAPGSEYGPAKRWPAHPALCGCGLRCLFEGKPLL